MITSLGHSDQWLTLLTAFGGELPLAVYFLWLNRRIILNTIAAFYELLGDGPPPRRLREAQILALPIRLPPTSVDPSVAATEHTLRINHGKSAPISGGVASRL